MNLKETKYYFENIFNSSWNKTPVHYAGMTFDGSKQSQWVNPIYKPMRNRSNGINDDTTVALGQLYVVCWADYDIDAMTLSDDVIAFLKEEVDGSLFRSRGYEVVDHGWDDSDKVFMLLSFTYEHFVGEC